MNLIRMQAGKLSGKAAGLSWHTNTSEIMYKFRLELIASSSFLYNVYCLQSSVLKGLLLLESRARGSPNNWEKK